MSIKLYLKNHKEKIYHSSYLFFLNLAIISFLFFLLNRINIINTDLILTQNWFFVIVIFSLLVSFISKEKFNLIENKKSQFIYSIFQVAPYLFLSILIILSINQFFKLDFFSIRIFYLAVLDIAFGFLTFYKNKDKVESKLEDEKIKEGRVELKRANEFVHKFPRINKIPVLRGIVKWMYKEGWSFSIPLIIIAIIFIGIKIGIPLIYNGSYIDEYYHILSGIEFFKTGHFANFTGMSYDRGMYVSFLVGLFFKLFGQTIFVAKMIPALIGIIDFFLLYFISRKIISRKKYILLLLLTYSFSPWVIMNHFYIRMYVFYEFFLLIFIFLFYQIYKNLKAKENSRVIIYSLIISFLATLVYYLSNDIGSVIVILIIPIFITNLYLFNIKEKKIFKVILLIFSLLIIFILFGGLDKVNSLLHGSLQFSTPSNLKYDYYFFDLNVIMSIFFLIAIFAFKKSDFSIFLVLSVEIIFFIHIISSSDLQILRGIMYFFPVYYLISIYSLSRLEANKLIKIALILLFFIILFNNYPSDFGKGPYISKEINYIDNTIFLDANKICDGSLIITSSRPAVLIFFKLKPDYYFNTLFEDPMRVKNSDSFLYSYNFNNSYYDYFSNIRILTSLDEFKEISNSNKVCYIEGGLPPVWVDSKSYDYIKNNLNLYKVYKSNPNGFIIKLFKNF